MSACGETVLTDEWGQGDLDCGKQKANRKKLLGMAADKSCSHDL